MQASASTITNYHKSWGAKLCYRLSSPRTIQEILTTSDHCSILLLPSLGHTSPRNRRNLEGTCPRMPAEPPDTGSRPAASGGLPGRQRLAKNVKDMACQRGLHHVIIRYIYYIYIYIIISNMAGVIPLLAFKFWFLFCPCSHIPCPQGLWFKEFAKGRPFLWGFRWHSFSCTARWVRLECEATKLQ